jgi:hypothetical protein
MAGSRAIVLPRMLTSVGWSDERGTDEFTFASIRFAVSTFMMTNLLGSLSLEQHGTVLALLW